MVMSPSTTLVSCVGMDVDLLKKSHFQAGSPLVPFSPERIAPAEIESQLRGPSNVPELAE